MKLYRIYGIILRHVYLFKHSINRWSDAIYWPTIDLLLWGLTISFVKSVSPNSYDVVFMVISGILLWIIIWRGQYEISVNILEELWNRNLINLFATPLKFSEWIVALVSLSIIKATLSLSFAAAVAFILYKVRLFAFGFYLIPFALLLFMTGWCVGFLVAGLILRFGSKVEQFAWSALYIFAPFSAIFYPLSILPDWAQKFALLIPTSYVFEGAREVMQKGYLDPSKLVISFILNTIYLILALFFFKRSFDKALKKGLVKIY